MLKPNRMHGGEDAFVGPVVTSSEWETSLGAALADRGERDRWCTRSRQSPKERSKCSMSATTCRLSCSTSGGNCTDAIWRGVGVARITTAGRERRVAGRNMRGDRERKDADAQHRRLGARPLLTYSFNVAARGRSTLSQLQKLALSYGS